jgi:hypothetical protein
MRAEGDLKHGCLETTAALTVLHLIGQVSRNLSPYP